VVRVKICGITRVEDARNALLCGADAIGLVFTESPRRVSVKTARRIVRSVGPWICSVGVFVDEKIEHLRKIVSKCGLNAVQLHGGEDAAYLKRLRSLNCKIIKAFRVKSEEDLSALAGMDADAFLFDAKVQGKFGGTGLSFDWNILKSRRIKRPVILSGGLCPANVKEAVDLLSPYGVDVSSGVEASPGRKDPKLVREFIRNAKRI